MQRWEYCTLWRRQGAGERWFLTICGSGAAAQELRPDTDTGERNLRAAWDRTMAALGRAGWELVAVDADGFYFKRPTPTGAAPVLRTAVLGSEVEPAPERARLPARTRGHHY